MAEQTTGTLRSAEATGQGEGYREQVGELDGGIGGEGIDFLTVSPQFALWIFLSWPYVFTLVAVGL